MLYIKQCNSVWKILRYPITAVTPAVNLNYEVSFLSNQLLENAESNLAPTGRRKFQLSHSCEEKYILFPILPLLNPERVQLMN